MTRRFEYDEQPGRHLGMVQGSDGLFRGLEFDDQTNELVSHAELREVHQWSEPDDDDAATDEGGLGTTLAVVGVTATVIAGVGVGVGYLRRRRERRRAIAAQPVPASLPAVEVAGHHAQESKAIAPGLQVDQVHMSSAEWQERMRAMVLARAFSEEQHRILTRAHIDDADPDLIAVQRAFASLTPQRFSDRVRLMLEGNPGLLTDVELRFLSMFGLGPDRQRERVPVASRQSQPAPGSSHATPPGWYDDGTGNNRWWDGGRWTHHSQSTSPLPASTVNGLIPAGWYPDGSGWLRWWNGLGWTGHTSAPERTRPR